MRRDYQACRRRSRTSGRALPAATWLSVIALLAAPTGSAEASFAVKGNFSADRLVANSEAPLVAGGLLFGAPILENQVTVDDVLLIQAEALDVKMTVREQHEVGGLLLAPNAGDDEIRRYHHGDVGGEMTATGRLNWLLAQGVRSDSRFSIGTTLTAPSFGADNKAEFFSMPSPFSPLDGTTKTDLAYMHVALDIAHIEVAAKGEVHPWILEGDIRISTYDFEIDLITAEGPVTYETGLVAVDDPLNVDGAVQRYEERRAELIFRNASLAYYPAGRPLEVGLADFSMSLTGPIQAHAATGDLSLGSSREKLVGSMVTIGLSSGTLSAKPTLENDPRIAVELAGQATEVLENGRPLSPGSTTARWLRPDTSIPLTLVSVIGAAGGGFLLLQVRRRQVVKHGDLYLLRAEDEYVHGKYRRAASRARRILREDPKNVDAAVLTSMALLKAGKPHTLLRRLRPLLNRDLDESGMVHLMASIGYFRAGDRARGEEALAAAMRRNPNLASELRGTELLAHDANMSDFRKYLNGETDSLPYA